MAWVSLILAGLFEMFGVAMINKLHKDRNWQSLALLVFRIWGKFSISCLCHENTTYGDGLCNLDRNWCVWWSNNSECFYTVNQKTGEESFLLQWC